MTGALDASGSDARVLMGVPTYDTFGFMHRAASRRPRTRWSASWPACAASARGGTFEGVALYAEWTTDEADWAVYERFWRNRPE